MGKNTNPILKDCSTVFGFSKKGGVRTESKQALLKRSRTKVWNDQILTHTAANLQAHQERPKKDNREDTKKKEGEKSTS